MTDLPPVELLQWMRDTGRGFRKPYLFRWNGHWWKRGWQRFPGHWRCYMGVELIEFELEPI